MSNSVFINPEDQHHFDTYGYVKITILNKADLLYLTGQFEKFYADKKLEGFHISLDIEDEAFVRETSELLTSFMSKKLHPWLKDFKLFTGSFVSKEPGLQYIVPPHQDWTFVDESAYYSASVWTPLVDVNIENGALGIIPGSHKYFNYNRCSPSPESPSPVSKNIFTMFPYIQMVEMKAGETLIFNNKLIHASPPNTTSKNRLAIGVALTHKDAALKHFYELPNRDERSLQSYDVDEEFFLTYNNKKLSKLFNLGSKPENVPTSGILTEPIDLMTEDAMRHLLENELKMQVNTELVNRLKHLYPQQKRTNTQQNNPVAEPKTASDNRTFFEKYTPSNIMAEIKWRLTKQN